MLNCAEKSGELCGQVLYYVDKSVGLDDKSVELRGEEGELCGRKC